MVKILHCRYMMTFDTNLCLIDPLTSLVTALKHFSHCPIDFCICLKSNRDHFASIACLRLSVFRNGFLPKKKIEKHHILMLTNSSASLIKTRGEVLCKICKQVRRHNLASGCDLINVLLKFYICAQK